MIVATGGGTAPTKGGGGAPTFDLFLPCNAHRVNVKILHLRGHGAAVPLSPRSAAYGSGQLAFRIAAAQSTLLPELLQKDVCQAEAAAMTCRPWKTLAYC